MKSFEINEGKSGREDLRRSKTKGHGEWMEFV